MRNQIDTVDLGALIALPIAAGMELGVWSLELNVFGGFDISKTLIELGGAEITLPFLVAIASIIALVAQGQVSQDDYQDEEWYVIAGSMAVLPLYVFVPAFNELVTMADAIPFVLWVALSGVSVYISYKG
ncbi:hypothetical protein SAMN05444422_1032 [Halobiforma haloterrestris]|uniref:Uncharacterized protein n=1 Tax=Natronobacterium haloterrestre TaxID=148448 RepID=A0A1I1EWT3_NATHA|nr:hypothetical protein [Halobiforma haloterrestris]SFB91437.1 hypothetical protein SAMN05444422_1032 [Halobiforma haloterrestris]